MDVTCSLGSFSPKWLRKFATIKSFMAVYGLLGMVQAMAFIYLITTITTMEKIFKIPSKTTGIILTGNEISQILLSLVLSYQGAHRNRPRWIAWGVACSALSCFVVALPHFIFGAGEEALALTKHHMYESGTLNNLSSSNEAHRTEYSTLCNAENPSKKCSKGGENNGAHTLENYKYVPLLIVFASQFILGIGNTLYYSLGQAYLDDNTKKSKTAVLLAWTFALRTLGPAFGFILGYLCLRLYVFPSAEPLIDYKDPRWLGAWWLGWIILGFIMLILAFLVAMFPRDLPVDVKINVRQKAEEENEEEVSLTNAVNNKRDDVKEQGYEVEVAFDPEKEYTSTALSKKSNNENKYQANHKSVEKPTFKGFKTALKRLLTNKILMCNNFSGVFYILGASGYITYITRYLEVQFQDSANSTVITGPITLIGMIVGFLASGYLITKYKPRPTYLFGWNVLVGLIYILGQFLFININCDIKDIHSFTEPSESFQILSSCNQNCSCSGVNYSPVCEALSDTTYFSPCHAGCVTKLKDSEKFTDCTCLTESVNNTFNNNPIVLNNGPCPVDCSKSFFIFVVASFTINVMGSSGKIGNLLVNYRSVDIKDKTFAQGLTLWMISLLALIPGPILYGAIIDSTCLIWNEACGKRGNCWLYDRRKMRVYVNSTAMILTSVAVMCDILVCYYGRNLDLYPQSPLEDYNLGSLFSPKDAKNKKVKDEN